ncbi:MAG: protein BatD, partial [Candidatus Riflebacteria bacterium]|nr:protein BatD [Candidatus Riflebacteria bacterium]
MRLANRCRLAGVALLLILMGYGLGVAGAADFSIEATVDRTKVKFGESLQLVITVTQSLGSGGGERLGAPQVSKIPGFDIAGQRTSHNMTIINGVGQVQLQTVVELVPQEPGNFNIPALQLQGPDGKVHATKPIAVTVLPPAPDEEAAAAGGSPADDAAAADESGEVPAGSRVGKILVVALFVLGAIIGAPILLSFLLNRGARPSTRWQDEETATITGTTTATTTGSPAGSPRPGAARYEGTRPPRSESPIED